MTDKELVDWLRNCSIYEGRAFLRQSADRIEELDRHLTLSGKVGKALSERIEALEAENERLREALFELQNQDIGRLHDLLNQALLLMRDDDMGLPGSDHWVWALDAIAALGGKK